MLKCPWTAKMCNLKVFFKKTQTKQQLLKKKHRKIQPSFSGTEQVKYALITGKICEITDK